MQPKTIFITGTDTGVGKTVLTALLAGCLQEQDHTVAALKPVCSGGRGDARVLHAALSGILTLEEINPWYFHAPIAPLLAARRERKAVKLSQVLAHIQTMRERFEVLLIEGAGGLLSPLGEDFDSRDLMTSLHAVPIVVCPNRLGVVNQVLLTLEALPRYAKAAACVVLISPPKPDASSRTNATLLAEQFDAKRILRLPWLGKRFDWERSSRDPRLKQTLRAMKQLFF